MELIVILFSLTFSILKWCKIINWSWIWIFAPMWIWGLILVAMIFYTSFSCEDLSQVDNINFNLSASEV